MCKTPLEIEIDSLMKSWAKFCHDQKQWEEAIFVEDGPFPFYEQQKTKILFIGRELYGKRNEGDPLTISYWNERECMEKLGVFQSRLLYLAYGIINGKYTEKDWIEMPNAKKLNDVLAIKEKRHGLKPFSYAFINASKILNTESKKTGEWFHEFITGDCKEKNLEFLLTEISLLNPDIIVSGNLGYCHFFDYFKKPVLSNQENLDIDTSNCCIWSLKLKNKEIKWIDTWHFSAPKSNFDNFYNPVCKAAKILLKKYVF